MRRASICNRTHKIELHRAILTRPQSKSYRCMELQTHGAVNVMSGNGPIENHASAMPWVDRAPWATPYNPCLHTCLHTCTCTCRQARVQACQLSAPMLGQAADRYRRVPLGRMSCPARAAVPRSLGLRDELRDQPESRVIRARPVQASAAASGVEDPRNIPREKGGPHDEGPYASPYARLCRSGRDRAGG
eukprot:366083-Chlamydomonas_euryale.AAC.1